jgi:hypothetical protein
MAFRPKRRQSAHVTGGRRVYRDPPQAIERLTADPRGPERLSAGQAATYGQLKGRGATLFRQPDLTRQAAENAVRSLRPVLDDYHDAARKSAGRSRPMLHLPSTASIGRIRNNVCVSKPP